MEGCFLFFVNDVLNNSLKKHLWSLYHQMLIVFIIFVIHVIIWLRSFRSIKQRLCFMLYFFVPIYANIQT